MLRMTRWRPSNRPPCGRSSGCARRNQQLRQNSKTGWRGGHATPPGCSNPLSPISPPAPPARSQPGRHLRPRRSPKPAPSAAGTTGGRRLTHPVRRNAASPGPGLPRQCRIPPGRQSRTEPAGLKTARSSRSPGVLEMRFRVFFLLVTVFFVAMNLLLWRPSSPSRTSE